MIDPTSIDFDKIVQPSSTTVERNSRNNSIIYLAIGLMMGLAGVRVVNYLSKNVPKNAKRN
jgi:hypothetical protein